MTWVYDQKTGALTHDGVLIATGYSGHGVGLDNPDDEAIPFVGPPPCGTYMIAAAMSHPVMGPIAMRLTQISGDEFGRSGFFIHGDNSLDNHSASEGCIVLAPAARQQIAASDDRFLTVVE